MKVSIVVPAYNEEEYIGKCLESLLALKSRHSDLIEIIVVNNASTDATGSVASSYQGVKVIDEPRKGLTKARQCGLEAATGDLIAYVDADSRVPDHWFSTIEKAFTKYPRLVSLSGPYRYHDGPLLLRYMIVAMWYLSAPVTYLFTGYMILGGNFIAKKEALQAIGGFDESIEFYGEDTDIARRLSTQGKVMFRMNFFVYSSTRRFRNQGTFMTMVRYALNFAWEVMFHKPFTGQS